MIKIKKILLLSTSMFLILACGGGGKNNSSSPNSVNEESITALEDKITSYKLDALEITTTTPIHVQKFENSLNIYFKIKNTSDKDIDVKYLHPRDASNDLHEQGVTHFFAFQEEHQRVKAKSSITIEYLVAGEFQQDVNINDFFFEIEKSSKHIDTPLKISQYDKSKELNYNGKITGKIVDEQGEALKNILVSAYNFNGYERYSDKSNSKGEYSIAVPSTEDIQTLFGKRPYAYNTLNYDISVADENHEFFFRGNIQATSNKDSIENFTLKNKNSSNLDYKLVGEYNSLSPHGVWWLFPNSSFEYLVAVHGRHPPEIMEKGEILALDLSGNKLWSVTTDSECWGFDISSKDVVSAGCSTGNLYITKDGEDVKTIESGNQNRATAFSPNGNTLLTGPGYSNEESQDLLNYNSETQQALWTYNKAREWIRSIKWSPDGERVIAGFSGGQISMFDKNGKELWKNFIGEFPLMLQIDKEYNIYAGGKNHEVVSYDKTGKLRWRYRNADNVVSAGSNNLSEDGSTLAYGTVAGWLHVLNTKDGSVKWSRRLEGDLQGHNALDMTPDGEYIAVGTTGDDNGGVLDIYSKDGTLLWRKTYKDSRSSDSKYSYDHNQKGVITVAISDDAEYISAGYGDSYIRIFKRK